MPRRDLTSYPKKRHYRVRAGMTAWLLHRITGALIFVYLAFHMLSSSEVCPFLGNVVRNFYVEAVFIVLFAFHALNGVRIILMEFFSAAEKPVFKKYVYGFGVAIVLISIAGIIARFSL